MIIPFYLVDAFTNRVFRGNPAAVCLLDRWLPDDVLQNIAFENNLSETAFVVRKGKTGSEYELRWFTPVSEVDLCGHATLATAFVLMAIEKQVADSVSFETKSGWLHVVNDEDVFKMDFPSREALPVKCPEIVSKALGAEPVEVLKARDLMVVFDDPQIIRNMQPDINLLAQIRDALGVIVTAPDKKYDFLSRFFAPNVGVPEDPVTGSAHCTLIPYWAKRLNKDRLLAFQASSRGGEIFCEYRGDRVVIGGKAVLFARGEILLSEVDWSDE